MAHSRRDFLVGGVSAGAAVPLLSNPLVSAGPLAQNGKTLVIFQIDGGWDYFNQIVPVNSSVYYDARPDLALPDRAGSVLTIEKSIPQKWPVYGQALKDLYDRGDLAVLNNVGFPNHTLSHFTSQARWWTAQENSSEGWLAGYLLRGYKGSQTIPALDASSTAAGAFDGARVPVIGNASRLIGFETDLYSRADNVVELTAMKLCADAKRRGGPSLLASASKMSNSFEVVRQLQTASQFHRPRATYPYDRELTPYIHRIAGLIARGFASHVYYMRTGSAAIQSFDNHRSMANKGGTTGTFPDRFRSVIGSIKAFLDDMAAYGRGKEVVVLVFSEFSRRLGQNGSQGTDHGHGGVAYLAGEPVKGGFYGKFPDLGRAVKPYTDWYPEYDRDTLDYRSVYASILEKGLGVSSQTVLGAKYPTLPIL